MKNRPVLKQFYLELIFAKDEFFSLEIVHVFLENFLMLNAFGILYSFQILNVPLALNQKNKRQD